MFVRVAVPVPQLDLLTYEAPAATTVPVVGARVVVPLGTRAVTGIVVEVVDSRGGDVDASKIKPLTQVLDDTPFVPAEVVELARWTAEYDAAGAGASILAVLPPNTRGTRADAHKTQRIARLKAGPSIGPPLGAKQQAALDRIAANENGVAVAALASEGISRDIVLRLAKAGRITIEDVRVARDPFAASALAATSRGVERTLTSEQAVALTRLGELAAEAAFRVAVLHGVTGSGKTEVYVRLADAVRRAGRQVLMLVPEIALTPAVAGIFRDAFGDRVAIQHSGLSDGERHDQWQRIRHGEVDVVVGTRSAVFAPFDRVGLIIVDEEHDASYKQEESPRYHARDVAIVRAQKAGALVVLGSATPSMESYFNAVAGKFEHLTLTRRVHDRPLADVQVVDMREVFAAEGPDVVLSQPLRAGLIARLERGEQAIVLLNRRGFATSIFCRQCAGTIDCPNCSVSLVIHGQEPNRRARCHYCDFSTRVPPKCPLCGAEFLEQAGFGTQRVEDEVKRLLPAARVARLDRDSVRRKGALTSLLSQFRDGQLDVLVGTQMMAKGHDFPRVTLVGVISADVGLGMADFRAGERTFQLLTQVAGRAGRGEDRGEAIIQTLYPEHYSIQLACRQDYPAFYERELIFRRAMRYPPLVPLINVVVHAHSMSAALHDAGAVAAQLRRLDANQDNFRVLGPAPAALAKLRGEYRSQVLIKGTRGARRVVREAVTSAIAARPAIARRTTVDVDPLTVL